MRHLRLSLYAVTALGYIYLCWHLGMYMATH